jgi:hypothetical protein
MKLQLARAVGKEQLAVGKVQLAVGKNSWQSAVGSWQKQLAKCSWQGEIGERWLEVGNSIGNYGCIIGLYFSGYNIM